MGVFEYGVLFGVAEVEYFASRARRKHCSHQAIYQIAYIADAAGNAAIAVDSQRLIAQSLRNKIGDHAPIVYLTIRTIGIENAHDSCIHLVLPVIFHGQGFAQSLALVVASSWPDGIDVAPVIFALRMHQRIAISL